MSIKASNLTWNNDSIATQNFVNADYMTLTGMVFSGLINFSTDIPLNTTYAGCRICLWTTPLQIGTVLG